MHSLTPNHTTYFLNSVEYLQNRKAISINFSNLNGSKKHKFKFFPSMLLSNEVEEELLSGLLQELNAKNFSLEKAEGSVKVSASTFSELKKFCNLVLTTCKTRPLLLEPERQFLLQKNWSYFDAFSFEEEPKKLNTVKFPQVFLNPFVESLSKTLLDLKKVDEEETTKITNALILSNLLKFPFNKIPESKFLQSEILLENIFFKSSYCPSTSVSEKPTKRFPRKQFVRFFNAVELDFLPIWAILLSKNFFNLGFDSLNCKCCTPMNLFEKNVLPSSLIEVEFLQDGIFFESQNKAFAEKFHKTHDFKENRLKRMKDFFLDVIPTGPFFRNQFCFVPLPDALKLVEQGKAIFTGKKDLKWFCRKKESFLSKEILGLKSLMIKTEKIKAELEKNSIKKHKLFGVQKLNNDLNYLFLKNRFEIMAGLIARIPFQLMNPSSRFYSTQLADSIQAIQFNIIEKFKQFSKKKGCKVLHFNYSKAFVETNEPLFLVEEFSKLQNIPKLSVVKNYSKAVLH